MKKDELHARVLYLYQILRHYSDSEHPLTTQQILKIMDEEYHIQIHRVSVQNYVEILNSCGIKVNQQRAQDKYYYCKRSIITHQGQKKKHLGQEVQKIR